MPNLSETDRSFLTEAVSKLTDLLTWNDEIPRQRIIMGALLRDGFNFGTHAVGDDDLRSGYSRYKVRSAWFQGVLSASAVVASVALESGHEIERVSRERSLIVQLSEEIRRKAEVAASLKHDSFVPRTKEDIDRGNAILCEALKIARELLAI